LFISINSSKIKKFQRKPMKEVEEVEPIVVDLGVDKDSE
jgi:hypothetical protein